MKYQFPVIKNINDVLPAIKDKKEFIVAEKESYTVINYTVAFHDTFDLDDDKVDNYGTEIPAAWIRRECRGIIFDKNGDLVSRPFHKFFNVGERAETKTRKLNMSLPHIVMEKMDGSMVRPIVSDLVNDFDEWHTRYKESLYDETKDVLGGPVPKSIDRWVAMERNDWNNEYTYLQHVRMATKMGFTDIADMADKVVDNALRNWMVRIMIEKNATPLFEFVAPDNRIVVSYGTPKLYLLAIRDNYTGRYWTRDEIKNVNCPADMVPQHTSIDGDMADYVESMVDQEQREGDVVQFADGHMVKIKTDWYLRLHRAKDQIRNNRRLLDLIINNGIDDLLPNLDEADYDRVVEFDKKFQKIYKETSDFLENLAKDCVEKATMPSEFFDNAEPTLDRKMVAVDLLPASGLNKGLYSIIFGYLDGRDVRESFLRMVRNSTASNKKYNDLAKVLGLELSEDNEDEDRE